MPYGRDARVSVDTITGREPCLSFGRNFLPVLGLLISTGLVSAQTQEPETPAADTISKTIKAVGYIVGGGATKVIFVGTSATQGSGEAKVEVKKGPTNIELKVESMPQANTLGTEFLTYVLWAITPDGHTINLGNSHRQERGWPTERDHPVADFRHDRDRGTLLWSASAERNRSPENDTKKNTKGKIYPDNDYKLMNRSQYAKMNNPLA